MSQRRTPTAAAAAAMAAEDASAGNDGAGDVTAIDAVKEIRGSGDSTQIWTWRVTPNGSQLTQVCGPVVLRLRGSRNQL